MRGGGGLRGWDRLSLGGFHCGVVEEAYFAGVRGLGYVKLVGSCGWIVRAWMMETCLRRIRRRKMRWSIVRVQGLS